MATPKLDAMDYKILQMLSDNARKPYLEIARICNVSGAAIHLRIQKLYSMGIIKGTYTQVDPSSVGLNTCAFLGIFLNDPSKFEEASKWVETNPEIVECYYTSGKYDMLVKIFARDNEHLLEICQQFYKAGFGRCETLMAFKEVFKRQIPIKDKN